MSEERDQTEDTAGDLFNQDLPDPDDILPVESDFEEEGDDAELEIDERQSSEIKQIFGTTLPQYLEPVEEMVEQILEPGSTIRATTVQAFAGTVSSLSAAASRMGFGEVYRILERMNLRVAQIAAIEDDIPEEISEAIRFDLDEIKALATKLSGGAAASKKESSPSLFSLLRSAPNLDEVVLQKLSAAGLMTVGQLRMARRDEVAAVSGLSLEVVDRLMRLALSAEATARGETSSVGSGIVALPIEEGTLRGQLIQKLQAQVEVEAAVDEIRAEVRRLRVQVADLRSELSRLDDDRQELHAALGAINAKLAQRVTALGKIRSSHSELTERAEEAKETVEREEERVLELRKQREMFVQEQDEVGRKVAGLVERVQRMIRIAARE